jgi:hypothetical protein
MLLLKGQKAASAVPRLCRELHERLDHYHRSIHDREAEACPMLLVNEVPRRVSDALTFGVGADFTVGIVVFKWIMLDGAVADHLVSPAYARRYCIDPKLAYTEIDPLVRLAPTWLRDQHVPQFAVLRAADRLVGKSDSPMVRYSLALYIPFCTPHVQVFIGREMGINRSSAPPKTPWTISPKPAESTLQPVPDPAAPFGIEDAHSCYGIRGLRS